MCSLACSTSVPTVTATTAGTPALAIPEISCRRVMATLFLFLLGGFFCRRFDFLCVGAVGGNPRYARFHAAVEALRCHPSRASHCSCDRADQRRRSHFELASRAEDWRICLGRRRQMDRHGLERPHLPHHAFFRAPEARHAGPDRPHARNFVEVPRRTGSVRHRTLAAEFVQAPALTVTLIAERRRKSSCIEMRPARTVIMN